ncbi:hypothetical protein SERLA73DRAFT_156596 [Serpula lacrymans var. lacrymans S7.3]|uniref:Uncharacterized protein n=2 Tax=Serpula lacrymans var. lacrymans TaxID=341189 RepID=F8QF49_SERL3|nr:uncharacterized protein SERLADRAFT_406798 [Serpula lacrymans var. lacrymans S7.9]EGN93008.1 hypothetical protein SERLA73DRAFT_156596 [Serpula lacrymans var. lacrymans S7.3]EGO27848.1 hypothetical protein SERLADRAFT_406798 [Serpula lacrymans var. lacrymans S7.9]
MWWKIPNRREKSKDSERKESGKGENLEYQEQIGQNQHAAARITGTTFKLAYSPYIMAPAEVEMSCPCVMDMNAESVQSTVDAIMLVDHADGTDCVEKPPANLGPFQSESAALPFQKPIRRSFPTPPPIEFLAASDDSEDEGGSNRLKLNRFAFKVSQSSIRSGSFPRTGHSHPGSLVTVGLAPLPKAKKSQSMSLHFAENFSNAEIGRLKKCISCDARWTTRKSANQKMAHMQSCTKKNALSDTTVRALIQKEVDAASDDDISKKGKAKASEQDDTTTTYLEKLVNGVSSKKGRRPTVLETVKTLPETRGDILARARAVLGNRQAEPFDAEPNTTQVFGQSKLVSKVPHPLASIHSTQIFAESALGHKQTLQG